MSEAELRQARQRAKDAEHIAANLKEEMQTIDVLVQHAVADLRDAPESYRVRAALVIVEGIQGITGTYR
jgi:hypothetical protein